MRSGGQAERRVNIGRQATHRTTAGWLPSPGQLLGGSVGARGVVEDAGSVVSSSCATATATRPAASPPASELCTQRPRWAEREDGRLWVPSDRLLIA